MEKHTIAQITIVWIKQNVRIIQESHYPGSIVFFILHINVST